MLQELHSRSDTIVARATAPGPAAVAIVRLSGALALAHGRAIAPRPRRGAARVMQLADVRDRTGVVIDRGLVVEMPGPSSYTGEDIVELHLHGSDAVVAGVMDHACALGARQAGPGEFSLRAFLNGRLSLAEAEAVADLISARDQALCAVAARQLRGELAHAIERLLGRVEDILAEWRATVDFPDYAGDVGVAAEHGEAIRSVSCTIHSMLSLARPELRTSSKVVLCGAPNVGKSTILNALCGMERAIVSEFAGTTRDIIEVDLQNSGSSIVLCDTAGLRSDADCVENLGIRAALTAIGSCERAIWLLDAINPVAPPADLRGQISECWLNKADLVPVEARPAVLERCEAVGLAPKGWISGVTGHGIDALRNSVTSKPPLAEETLVTRERHIDCLRRAALALERTLAGLDSRAATLDLLIIDLESCAAALGEVLGRNVDAAVLARIFEKFCIGK